MQPFDYQRPGSIAEVLDALDQYGDGARTLAGGQSLLVLLRQRLVSPEVVVDLKAVPELGELAAGPGGLRVGATVTYRQVATSPVVREGWPLLARAAKAVGSMHIRERGTIGGAVAHSDPAGDVPVALMALGAMVVVRSRAGERRIPADSFPTGMFATQLRLGEIVVAVEVPPQPAGATAGYERFLLREGEFPLTQAAVRLEWEDQRCTAARVVVGGGFDRPARLAEVEDWMAGMSADAWQHEEFVARVERTVHPYADIRGSAEWKGHVVGVIAARACRQAIENRRQEHG